MYHDFMREASKKRKRDPEDEDYPDVYEVLDALLGQDFKSLQTNVSKPKNQPSPEVTATIAKRSPQLTSLTLSFQHSFWIETAHLRSLV